MSVHPAVRYVVTVLGLTTALAAISFAAVLLQPVENVSLIYPATGLGAALLWGYGMRWWPAVFLVQFFLSYRGSQSLWVSSLVAVTELLIILLFCSTMLRLRVSQELHRVRDLSIFILTALLTTTIGGVVSAIGEVLTAEYTRQQVLFDSVSFWLSDFVSMLVFVPLVLGWRRWPFPSRLHFRRWLALTALLMTLGAVIARSHDPASSTLFLLLPIVVFTAIVAGVPGAAASGAILLVILLGIGSPHHPSRVTPIVHVVFIGTATATAYALAVLWTEREHGAKRLYHLAHHDPLTELYNRHELERRLTQACESGPQAAHALLYLDLDQFKLVNDTCGHMAGDRMLQELAAELRRAAPPDAIFARLGGDEFACILIGATKDEALAVANALHDATDRYRFYFASKTFTAGVSIGITFFPAAEGDTADTVLGRADVACYVAKEDGRHRSHVYLPSDEAMVKWHATIHEVAQLEGAMEHGDLRLYAQRIADLTGQSNPNFHEVLLRLRVKDVIRPSAEFLPVAQRFGLMDRIDRWVVERAAEHLAASRDRGLRLSVNISGSTLNDPAFYEHVIALPEKLGFDARRLCLEVTEGVMIHRLRQAVEAMKNLRARGFDLALDDFGAGVASFAYLQELPVTYVKIDGRIVRDLRTDPASEVIIGTLVRLASMRKIECIAEWVEDEETCDRLRALGVRYAQGYVIEEPRELEG